MTAPPSTRTKIESTRLALAWSYYRLAQESGVPENTVRDYLQGRTDTSTGKADRMMAAMDNTNERD